MKLRLFCFHGNIKLIVTFVDLFVFQQQQQQKKIISVHCMYCFFSSSSSSPTPPPPPNQTDSYTELIVFVFQRDQINYYTGCIVLFLNTKIKHLMALCHCMHRRSTKRPQSVMHANCSVSQQNDQIDGTVWAVSVSWMVKKIRLCVILTGCVDCFVTQYCCYVCIHLYIYIHSRRNPADRAWAKIWNKSFFKPVHAWTVIIRSLSLSIYIYIHTH